MTFINWPMLIGLVAVAVPIIIHLLNRSRARVIDWGAMRFLLASLTSQNRRILLEEIILLALRCLLVALVALAIARPFVASRARIPWAIALPAFLGAVIALGVAAAMWQSRKARLAMLAVSLVLALVAAGASAIERFVQQLKWASGQGERDVALVLDASMSMTLKVEGKTNFARAIEEAKAVVNACRPGDAVSVILAGPVPRAVVSPPKADRKAVLAVLDHLKPVGGTMSVLEALNVAAASLAEGNNAIKNIVLITDGQNVGWDIASRVRWEFLAESLHQLDTPPKIICRRLPLPKTFRNAAIAEVNFSRKVVGTDRPVRIHVKVMNTGTVTLKPQGVELFVDGTSVGREQFATEIPPKAAETVTFSHRFAKPGPRIVEARLLCHDDLPGDNRQARVLDVLEKLPVLLVDGVPSSRPLGGAAAFLEIALSPVAADQQDGSEEARYVVEPRVVPAPEIASVADFRQFAVVVLANVPMLPSRVAQALVEFVERGGGLLIAPGIRVKPTFYNSWARASGEPVVPARLAERRVVDHSPRHLEPKTFSHPALRLVSDPEGSDISAALVKSYWKLAVDERDRDVRVGGRLNTGEPFLVERKLGKGRVAILATALDPTCSNLPALRSFVPLVHELVYYLAAPTMLEPNVAPGGEVVLELRLRGGRGLGLRGQYFEGKAFERPKTARVDPVVDFNWGESAPAPGVGSDNFSVRWTGYVVPPRDDAYTFHVVADDGVRLWLDGKKLVDAWQEQMPTEYSARVRLRAGRPYPLKLEYYEATGNAVIRLLWSSAHERKQPIPPTALRPERLPSSGGEGQSVEVVTPTGRRLPARLEAEGATLRVRFGQTQEPGLYSVAFPPTLATTYGLEKDGTIPFVVLTKVEESILEGLSRNDFERAGQYADLVEADRTEELTAHVTGRVPGDEIWKYLAIGALLVIVAEIAVSRWVALQRRLHVPQTVEFGTEAVDVQTFRERARQLLAARTESERTVSQT